MSPPQTDPVSWFEMERVGNKHLSGAFDSEFVLPTTLSSSTVMTSKVLTIFAPQNAVTKVALLRTFKMTLNEISPFFMP